jgi:hypothetical protein
MAKLVVATSNAIGRDKPLAGLVVTPKGLPPA